MTTWHILPLEVKNLIIAYTVRAVLNVQIGSTTSSKYSKHISIARARLRALIDLTPAISPQIVKEVEAIKSEQARYIGLHLTAKSLAEFAQRSGNYGAAAYYSTAEVEKRRRHEEAMGQLVMLLGFLESLQKLAQAYGESESCAGRT